MAARGNGLSELDIRTLEFIVEYEKVHLFPPSLREIAERTGVRSTSSIFMRVRKLEDYGKLSIDESGRITLRGYSVVSSKDAELIKTMKAPDNEKRMKEKGGIFGWRKEELSGSTGLGDMG